ncbi:MAG: NUDIX domain-containing protein [Candidatus Dojkabacteria bacterium]
MPRKTKIVGLSLPPEIYNQVETYLEESHKTRSEFYRELIHEHFSKQALGVPFEKNIASVLMEYWNMRTSGGVEVLPIVLTVITNKKHEVLIGARKQEDKWVDNLKWVFPGGRLESLDFQKEAERLAKEETNLQVKVKQLIATRIHPDSGFKNIQIVALFFHCEVNGEKEKPGKSLSELKWVKPLDVYKYFTTSTCDEVTKFLTMIEKSK